LIWDIKNKIELYLKYKYNLTNIKMTSNAYQLCDEWGWFIDIEHNDNCKNISLQPCNYRKKIYHHLNKLQIIEEDEYEYYQKNYKDSSEENFKEPYKKSGGNITLVKLGSTTLITALLTYVIFFVL